jgi:hypothetical protein
MSTSSWPSERRALVAALNVLLGSPTFARVGNGASSGASKGTPSAKHASTTDKGTRIALAVCSVAVEKNESLDAFEDPEVSGHLEQWLSTPTGGGAPCEIKDDFDAEESL